MRALSQNVDGRPLAACRVMVGLSGVVISAEVSAVLSRVAEGAVAAPSTAWLPGVTSLGTAVWLSVAVGASTALTLGLLARRAAATLAGAGAWALLWDQQTYSNHLVLLTALSALLVLCRPAASWRLGGSGGPTRVPAWPLVSLMTQVSVLYLFAALSKLNGYWLSGQLLEDHLRVTVPGAALPLMAAATVVIELVLAAGLWWGHRIWWLIAGAGVGLHVSIVLMMNNPLPLLAFALLSWSVYPLFWQRARPQLPVPRAGRVALAEADATTTAAS